jgi:predicted GNAT family acetyltransferase
VCWSGANLVPVVPPGLSDGEADDAVAAFAGMARRQGRRSSSIVGERSAALRLWEHLEPVWPPAREVRADQPSLAIDRDPDLEPEPRVRRSTLEDLDVVLPACVRMFTEEVGYSPVASAGGAYEMRVRSLVAEGRSFVQTARDDGAVVVFKAELGAVAGRVAQVQGVWVDPAYRRRGLAAPGMAAVVRATRRDVAPVVSLYVNSYNAPALATYRRVGFERVGTYATVLF